MASKKEFKRLVTIYLVVKFSAKLWGKKCIRWPLFSGRDKLHANQFTKKFIVEHSQPRFCEARAVGSNRLQKEMHLSQTLKCIIATGLHENNHMRGIIDPKILIRFNMEHQSSSLIISSHPYHAHILC